MAESKYNEVKIFITVESRFETMISKDIFHDTIRSAAIPSAVLLLRLVYFFMERTLLLSFAQEEILGDFSWKHKCIKNQVRCHHAGVGSVFINY